MTFQLALFLHVAATVGLFVTLTVEWICVGSMRRATTYEEARHDSRLYRALLPLGIPSTIVALATGVYLATTLGFWGLSWVKLAVPALVLVAIAGGLVGPRRNRIQAAVATGSGPLPDELKKEVGHALLRGSLRFRAVILAALVFVMTTKPAGPTDVVVLAASVVVALAIAAART
jgi:hypothetical protein